MKKLTKILAVILLAPILLFGGCFFPTYDEDGDDNGLDFMSGYKVCYKSDSYELDNTFELYATYILQELYANFGIVSDTQKSIMAEKPLIGNVQKYCNPSLTIDGLLLTKYSPRAVINRQLKESLQEVAEQLKTKVYIAAIREAVAIREAQLLQSDIFTEQPKANVTQDYTAFINEFLKGEPKA